MDRTEHTPLSLLTEEFLTEALPALPAVRPRTFEEGPQKPRVVKTLAELQEPVYGNDPNELLKHRFLYRGGVCLLCGPTGVGKSALLMQFAIHWAIGRECFGIVPGEIYQAQGLRILLVQAENDEGDLAEMRAGVLLGCDGISTEERALAVSRIWVATVADRTGDAFGDELAALLKERTYDLVIVDPAFAYLGGDGNSQRDVSHFMRDILNPLLQKHSVGLVLAHHTNKPLRGKEKENWSGSDYAYLGAGSAEWINPARAALAIRSIGMDDVFELRAAKRGKRLRWTDAEGKPTLARLIGHDGREGVICWKAVDAGVVADQPVSAKPGRPRQFEVKDAVRVVLKEAGCTKTAYLDKLAAELGCSGETARKMVREAVERQWLKETGRGVVRSLEVTEQGLLLFPRNYSLETAESKNPKKAGGVSSL